MKHQWHTRTTYTLTRLNRGFAHVAQVVITALAAMMVSYGVYTAQLVEISTAAPLV